MARLCSMKLNLLNYNISAPRFKILELGARKLKTTSRIRRISGRDAGRSHISFIKRVEYTSIIGLPIQTLHNFSSFGWWQHYSLIEVYNHNHSRDA